MRSATQNSVIRCLYRVISEAPLQLRNIPVKKRSKTRYTSECPRREIKKTERGTDCAKRNAGNRTWILTTRPVFTGHADAACVELDISIMPFFEYEYDSLSDEDKRLFVRLLESDDPYLFNWLMNHGKPADTELQRMVQFIQTRNRERGPVAAI